MEALFPPTLPRMALAVRQPWAWAIIHAGKDIENRTARAITMGSMQPGRIAIHAGLGMSRREYELAADFMRSIGVTCPPAFELWRGGIIGQVRVIEIVKKSDSPWFFGPRGLVLAEPKASEFIPVAGQLGYWQWRRRENGMQAEPLPWMLRGTVRFLTAATPPQEIGPQIDMFRSET